MVHGRGWPRGCSDPHPQLGKHGAVWLVLVLFGCPFTGQLASLRFCCLFLIIQKKKKKVGKEKTPHLQSPELGEKTHGQLCAGVSSRVLCAAGSKAGLLTVCHTELCRRPLQVGQEVLGCYKCYKAAGAASKQPVGRRWVWVRQNSTAVLPEWQMCG